ncbi:MAG: DNA repair protein RadA [Actinomycetia bacterium]|nr:DNA repair protein RadA [Actinomycetes bacterium]MCP3910528.1 DNA repair protein RadA [Actinomycetes bacterium]MCP4088133.1 DNA repair protein RadA [Actinomycetes bacterium]
MARVKTVHRCTECGASHPKWAGRCDGCGEWNTLVEELDVPVAASPVAGPSVPAAPITQIDISEWSAEPTGLPELDRVLDGGLVAGSVTLVGGEPGVGKSTLLLQLAAARARVGSRVLYVSAEESLQQVRLRAERLDALVETLWLASETDLPALVTQFDEVKPDLVVVDSIQTVFDPELGSAPGSVVQVRECTHRLVREAKVRALPMLLVGHVTKEGGLAGPRVLEHLVDTVLAFEGERHHALRLLRAVKHRFGSTQELGLFEMTEAGMEGVPDPSRLFLHDRRDQVPGSVVVPTMEGHRPLLVELQTLTVGSKLPSPRRSAQGLDQGRLSLLLAVLQSRTGLDASELDVYALAVGGVKITEPGADLALALALVSSTSGVAVPSDVVACGEVGLGGEIRQVGLMPRRLAEAARLGFKRAVVPEKAPDPPPGITLIRACDIADAVRQLGLASGAEEPF